MENFEPPKFDFKQVYSGHEKNKKFLDGYGEIYNNLGHLVTFMNQCCGSSDVYRFDLGAYKTKVYKDLIALSTVPYLLTYRREMFKSYRAILAAGQIKTYKPFMLEFGWKYMGEWKNENSGNMCCHMIFFPKDRKSFEDEEFVKSLSNKTLSIIKQIKQQEKDGYL